MLHQINFEHNEAVWGDTRVDGTACHDQNLVDKKGGGGEGPQTVDLCSNVIDSWCDEDILV